MDSAVAGLIGALIGGLATIIGTFIAHNLQMRQARDQWLKAKREETYLNTIRHLVQLLKNRASSAEGRMNLDTTEAYKEAFDQISEAQIWLTSLTIYCSKKEREMLTNLSRDFTEASIKFMKDAQDLMVEHQTISDEIRLALDFPLLWETYVAVLESARADLGRESPKQD
jgi:hypothetical protein